MRRKALWLVFYLSVPACFIAFAFSWLLAGNLSDTVESFGLLAPLAFIALFSVKPLIWPGWPAGFSALAGAAFGVSHGAFYVFCGYIGSAFVAFWIARKFGQGYVRDKLPPKLKKADRVMCREGWVGILFLRLIRIPWDAVSYSAGVSGVNFRDFCFGSLVSAVPIAFVGTYFGNAVGTLDYGATAIAVFLWLSMVTFSLILRRIIIKSKEGSAEGIDISI